MARDHGKKGAAKKAAPEKRQGKKSKQEAQPLYKPVKPVTRRPFPPLPVTTEKIKVAGYRCVVGCQLPLKLGGVKPAPNESYTGSGLIKAARRNVQALVGLATKIMGPAALNSMTPQSYSVNRIIYVRLSELVPCEDNTAFLKNGFDYNAKLIDTVAFGVKIAEHLCRQHGYRFVLMNDMGHTADMLQWLSWLYIRCGFNSNNMFRICLSLHSLENEYVGFRADYRLFLNPGMFSVVNDVRMDHTSASAYLTFCILNELQYAQQLNKIDKAVEWLNKERKRLGRCRRPLIIIDKRFTLTLNNVDAVLSKLVDLAKHTDVLVRRHRE